MTDSHPQTPEPSKLHNQLSSELKRSLEQLTEPEIQRICTAIGDLDVEWFGSTYRNGMHRFMTTWHLIALLRALPSLATWVRHEHPMELL